MPYTSRAIRQVDALEGQRVLRIFRGRFPTASAPETC